MMEVDIEDSDADPEGNLSVWIAGRVCFMAKLTQSIIHGITYI